MILSLSEGLFFFFAALYWGGSAATGTMLTLANGTRDSRDLAITSDLTLRVNIFLNTPALLGVAPFLLSEIWPVPLAFMLDWKHIALGLYILSVIFWFLVLMIQMILRLESRNARQARRVIHRHHQLLH